MDRKSMSVSERQAVKRLIDLVATADQPTYVTSGGSLRLKSLKRRQQEHAVAQEVVRFAFDHAGITGGYLAPTGLYLDLLDEVRAEDEAALGSV
jgi:hypothetical protein